MNDLRLSNSLSPPTLLPLMEGERWFKLEQKGLLAVSIGPYRKWFIITSNYIECDDGSWRRKDIDAFYSRCGVIVEFKKPLSPEFRALTPPSFEISHPCARCSAEFLCDCRVERDKHPEQAERAMRHRKGKVYDDHPALALSDQEKKQLALDMSRDLAILDSERKTQEKSPTNSALMQRRRLAVKNNEYLDELPENGFDALRRRKKPLNSESTTTTTTATSSTANKHEILIKEELYAVKTPELETDEFRPVDNATPIDDFEGPHGSTQNPNCV
ncbi:unnamed protein product [Amoebophrya sp. A25]|nr:unnamed protein product [Amoebophrya sp. A25]|eukprot:GSA25T00016058001.1